MKLFGLFFVALAFAQAPAPTELTDAEKVHLLNENADLLAKIDKLNKMKGDVDATSATLSAEIKQLQQSHHALGCTLSQLNFKWENCKPVSK